MMIVHGIYNAFGVFLKPVLIDFGWTRAVTSGAFSLSMIVFGLLGIVMGGLNDRFGPRIVLSLCGFFLGFGYLLVSQVSAIWQLYLFYGVIIGAGMSGTWVPLLSTVARWFTLRRSLMSAIILSGVSIGGFITPQVATYLITIYGWRTSFIILGSTILIVVLLAAQLLKRDPTKVGQLPYGEIRGEAPQLKSGAGGFSLKEAVRLRQFWLLFSMLFSFGFCVFSMLIHIVPHATELGISAVSSARILGTMSGFSIVGRLVLGSAADKIGNRRVFLVSLALMVAALLWVVPAKELWKLYLYAAVYGFAFGGGGTIESPLAAELFGLRSHGLIFGVVDVGFTIGAAAGPFVAGYIFDVTNSYQVAFLVSAAVGVVGLILAALLTPTKKNFSQGGT